MFVITGKIGNEICSIRCDTIENIQKRQKDTDTVFISGDLAFSGDKIVIDKMLKENTVDHGYVGVGRCAFMDNYLSGELSAYGLLYNYAFDSVISTEDDWEWKKFVKNPRVAF